MSEIYNSQAPTKNKSNSPVFLIVLYLIGTIGWSIAYSKEIFSILTPISQVIAAFILFRKHDSWNIYSIIGGVSIFILTFFTEALGVATGFPFGTYYYGASLGLKLLDVPLIIGLNWVMISYACYHTARLFTVHKVTQVILSASLMVLLDVLMELVAPEMDMWYFSGAAPLANYIAWFVLGIFCSVIWLITTQKHKTNRLGFALIILQYIFFATLNITL